MQRNIMMRFVKKSNCWIKMGCLRVIIITIIFTFLYSCEEDNNRTLLLFSSKESVIKEKGFALDSIVVLKTNNIILIRQYRGIDRYLESKYIKTKDGYSELRGRYIGLVEKGKTIDPKSIVLDTLPVFNLRDTTFKYKSARDFYPTTIDLCLGDAIYKIRKQGKTFSSSRQSAIDSRYKEYYFYNDKLEITKFIVIYRGNMLVYSILM